MLDLELSEEILERSKSLPSEPSPITLVGSKITLKPLDKARDLENLYNYSNGTSRKFQNKEFPAYDPEIIWRYLEYGPFSSFEDFENCMDSLLARPRCLIFSIYSNSDNIPIGSISLKNNYPEHLKVEIGSVWVSNVVRRTGVFTEASFLLLDHVFKLGYRRVEAIFDVVNIPSYQFALKIGFSLEFVEEFWGVSKNAFYFCVRLRILDFEWNQEIRKKYLEEFLREECLDYRNIKISIIIVLLNIHNFPYGHSNVNFNHQKDKNDIINILV